MPRQPTASENRLNNLAAYLAPALALLDEITDAFGSSFIQPISEITRSLLTTVKNARRNRDGCIRLTENIHQVLYAIVSLHLNSETPGTPHSSVLGHMGKFSETLHKIHTYVEAQQDGSKFKLLFCRHEMNTLLTDCRSGMDEALEVFKIESGTIAFQSIAEMKHRANKMHNELLELISTLSEGTLSDNASSVYEAARGSQSSSSFSILPSKPKIFNGRESELAEILKILAQNSPRLAILGGGGMGKTSLARVVLHHPEIATKFKARYFISAESAITSIELAALIGLHVGLKSGKDPTQTVVQYFSRQLPCLVILDNLETPWEPMRSRGGVEEFLSLLTDLPRLALIITMRGAERPAKVAWTRPFLRPLAPLSDDAAQKTFRDITDNVYDNEDMSQLLKLTENMPLAVDLIAHLADYEGCMHVLARWETEKTSLFSVGNDRRSNFAQSIHLSLSSPRMTSGAKELLSLLSILPDGLSDVELLHINFPIKDIRSCKAALLSTSLTYVDNNKRLRALMPIREHIRLLFPPSPVLAKPIRTYFHSLLVIFLKYKGSQQIVGLRNQIVPNLGNLQEILQLGLQGNGTDLVDTVYSILSLNSFNRITNHGPTLLVSKIPSIFPQLKNTRVEVYFIIEALLSIWFHSIPDPELLIDHGISRCNQVEDPALQAQFCLAAGFYHYTFNTPLSTANEFFEKALKLSRSCGDLTAQSTALSSIGELEWKNGDPSAALILINEARSLANLSANIYQEARALWMAARCTTQLGDYRNTVLNLNRAKELLGICGMSGGFVDSDLQMNSAEVHLLKTEYSEARKISTHILLNSDQDPEMHAWALVNIAKIDVMTDKTDDVRKKLIEAKAIFSTTKYVPGVACCEIILADLKLGNGSTVAAKALLRESLNSLWGSDNQLVSFALERLAYRKRWHVSECTFTWPTVYLGHARKVKDKLAFYKALFYLGDVFRAEEDRKTAHSLFTVALEGFTCMGIHRNKAECLLRFGDLADETGDSSRAIGSWRAARPLFERSSQARSVAEIDEKLVEIKARPESRTESSRFSEKW